MTTFAGKDTAPSHRCARARLWHSRAAALLAVKDKWIALTTLLACLPALAKWIGFVAFFIAIMIYGF